MRPNWFVYPPWECGYAMGERVPSPIAKTDYISVSSDELKQIIVAKEKLLHNRKFHRAGLMELPYEEFMMTADILGVNGAIIEAYINRNALRIDPTLENGDREENGIRFQFKVSFIDSYRPYAGFRRIQKWHTVDQYRFVIVNKSSYYIPRFYVLSKDQLIEELSLLCATPTNGTKKSNMLNRRRHLSIELTCQKNNEDFIRWENRYRRKDMEKEFLNRVRVAPCQK
jgi:hypothetical protein